MVPQTCEDTGYDLYSAKKFVASKRKEGLDKADNYVLMEKLEDLLTAKVNAEKSLAIDYEKLADLVVERMKKKNNQEQIFEAAQANTSSETDTEEDEQARRKSREREKSTNRTQKKDQKKDLKEERKKNAALEAQGYEYFGPEHYHKYLGRKNGIEFRVPKGGCYWHPERRL